uniref:Uncharacterized protein n=1 Tax=Candidatus Kentrum sp. TUN TaxID=2126343 RepID=A0A451A2X6_9GAMM|nr:MAG: hypothetical protein BECKTUN1418D_GA0071000_11225 [Candidatus Kentron sp. TUN]
MAPQKNNPLSALARSANMFFEFGVAVWLHYAFNVNQGIGELL